MCYYINTLIHSNNDTLLWIIIRYIIIKNMLFNNLIRYYSNLVITINTFYFYNDII